MLKLNFFDPMFQEKLQNNVQFGLCDNEDGTAAFIDTMNKDKWIATVKNPYRHTLIFTAIDKGVIKDNEYSGYERCDGMLTSDYHLYFVELKNERGDWVQKGISQLGSTIKLFDEVHPEKKKQYAHKKAYICNKKHPHFYIIDNEQNIKFFRDNGLRLDIQAKILLSN